MKKRNWKIGLLVGVFLLTSVGLVGSAGAQEVLKATMITPGLLTPGHMTEGAGAHLAGAVYDWLVRCKPGTTGLRPELAESWEALADGRIWTVHLREGVKFHNGAEFTADDVVFSVERTQDPEIGHTLKTAFEIVDHVEKVDKYTVRFHLKKPNVKLMHTFTDYNAAILCHTYDYEKYGETKPMGTGPFMVKKILPRESAILVRNPDYWMEGAPRVDEIHWTWIPDTSTQMMMLETGAVDMIFDISPIDAIRIAGLPDCKLYAVSGCISHIIYMRSDQPPFNDNRVRLALKYCIDPEVMKKMAFSDLSGDVEVAETPVTSIYPEYIKLPPRERDIEKAKALLADAGYPDGLDVDLYFGSNFSPNLQIALSLQEMARPAGIKIKLIGLPRDIYLSKYWLNVNFGITGWGNRVDPVTVFNLAYKTGAPWNESHYANPRLDELIDGIASEIDPEKRKELYAELQEFFYEEGPISILFKPLWHGLREKVEGYEESITFYGDWRFVEIK